MWLSVLLLAAQAGTCPSVDVAPPNVEYQADRAWMHKRGWFTPLTDPATVPLTEETYPDDEPMLVVQVETGTRVYPVRAMAQHHVANDIIGGTPITVTY